MRRKNNPKKRRTGRIIGLVLGTLFGVCVVVVCVFRTASTHQQNYRGIIVNDLQDLEIKKP